MVRSLCLVYDAGDRVDRFVGFFVVEFEHGCATVILDTIFVVHEVVVNVLAHVYGERRRSCWIVVKFSIFDRNELFICFPETLFCRISRPGFWVSIERYNGAHKFTSISCV